VWLGSIAREPAARIAAAAREIEALGYGALWFPEYFGSREAFATASHLLASTERIVVASGIANVWVRDAVAMVNGARTLADAYPDRFLLGIGISHPEQLSGVGLDYAKPVSAMRAYLDRMESAPFAGATADRPVETVLAALRPRMLEVARERTRGAHPYFTPVEHTRRARELLGPGKLLLPEQACVLASEPETARRVARGHAGFYLTLANYRANLTWLGYGDADLEDAGSDRLVDEVIAWGDAAAIAARVREHLDAGADHVCVQPIDVDGDALPVGVLRELAPALLAL
jgi:probable F420-dependent oxidoreductase